MENALLLAGFAGVGAWVGSNAIPAVWQSWENWVFDRQARGETVTVTAYLTEKRQQVATDIAAWLGFHSVPDRSASTNGPPLRPPYVENNSLVGRLAIPRLHLTTTVREGTGEGTLLLAAGHIRGTAFPGQKGNVGLAGHRDTLFRGLRDIRKWDLIQFETLDGRYLYEVASIEIVKPDNVGVLKASQYPELTLVTCYPFDYLGSAPDRFVVKARQVDGSPLQRSLIEASEEVGRRPSEPASVPAGMVVFSVDRNHSQQLAPGISLGVTGTDVEGRHVDGWMWIMPDRRTIWLRNQPAQVPLIFYQNGARRQLLITKVTRRSAAGRLLVHG